MRVKLSHAELYPYYAEWHGYGTPDFDLDIPDDLYQRYTEIILAN